MFELLSRVDTGELGVDKVVCVCVTFFNYVCIKY